MKHINRIIVGFISCLTLFGFLEATGFWLQDLENITLIEIFIVVQIVLIGLYITGYVAEKISN